KKCDLFFAVTKDDNINIVSCSMAGKLNLGLNSVAKVEDSFLYFDDTTITPGSFGITKIIDPAQLSIDKIKTLIENTDAIELIDYANKQTRLVGIKVHYTFTLRGLTLTEISEKAEIFKKIRIVAIYRYGKIIIPHGKNVLRHGDKIYIIGKTENVQQVVKEYFARKKILNHIIIVGGNKTGKELAETLVKEGKRVTIIVQDAELSKKFAEEIDGVLVIHGSGIDDKVLNDVNIGNSCLVSITGDDDYNVMCAAAGKKYGISKTICTTGKIALVPVINTMPTIDAVCSPHLIAVGEMLSYFHKGESFSITTFSGMEAETIEIVIEKKAAIVNKPLKEIKFPKGMIIGVIVRDSEIIIPTGNDVINVNDKVIIFLIPSVVNEVENLFTKKTGWGK
ncbi:MAG: NAD-binding protein, partial [Actinomycetia bacterium]|nr:NAD-binding protein [Actinomycetes bacterium]